MLKRLSRTESVKLPHEVMRMVTAEAADRGAFKTRIMEAMAELWRRSDESTRSSALRAVGWRAVETGRRVARIHGPAPADPS